MKKLYKYSSVLINTLFIIAFFLLILSPTINKYVSFGKRFNVINFENRKLVEKPVFNNVFNTYAREYNKYYNDSFNLRNFFVQQF